METCPGCSVKERLSEDDIELLIQEQLALEFYLVSDEEWEKRQKICQQCPFKIGKTCGKCGCYFKFRSALFVKSCPVGKW